MKTGQLPEILQDQLQSRVGRLRLFRAEIRIGSPMFYFPTLLSAASPAPLQTLTSMVPLEFEYSLLLPYDL